MFITAAKSFVTKFRVTSFLEENNRKDQDSVAVDRRMGDEQLGAVNIQRAARVVLCPNSSYPNKSRPKSKSSSGTNNNWQLLGFPVLLQQELKKTTNLFDVAQNFVAKWPL